MNNCFLFTSESVAEGHPAVARPRPATPATHVHA